MERTADQKEKYEMWKKNREAEQKKRYNDLLASEENLHTKWLDKTSLDKGYRREVEDKNEQYSYVADDPFLQDEFGNAPTFDYTDEQEFADYKDYVIKKEDSEEDSDEESVNNDFNLRYVLESRYSNLIEKLELDYALNNKSRFIADKMIESYKPSELILLFLYEVSLNPSLFFSDDNPSDVNYIKTNIFDKKIYDRIKNVNPLEEPLITAYFPNSTQKWFTHTSDTTSNEKIFFKNIMKNISLLYQDNGYSFDNISKNKIHKYLKLDENKIEFLKTIDTDKLIFIPTPIIAYYIPEYLIEIRNQKTKYFGSYNKQMKVLSDIYSSVEKSYDFLEDKIYDKLKRLHEKLLEEKMLEEKMLDTKSSLTSDKKKRKRREEKTDDLELQLTAESKKRKKNEQDLESSIFYDEENVNILKDNMEEMIVSEKPQAEIEEYKKFIDNYDDNYNDVTISFDKDNLFLLKKEYEDSKEYIFDAFAKRIEDKLNSKITEKIDNIADRMDNMKPKPSDIEKHIEKYFDLHLDSYSKIENILRKTSYSNDKKESLFNHLKKEKDGVIDFFKKNIDGVIKQQSYDNANTDLKNEEIRHYLVTIMKILYNERAYTYIMNNFDKDIFKNKSKFEKMIRQADKEYKILQDFDKITDTEKYDTLEREYDTIQKYKKDDAVYKSFYIDATKRFLDILPKKNYNTMKNDIKPVDEDKEEPGYDIEYYKQNYKKDEFEKLDSEERQTNYRKIITPGKDKLLNTIERDIAQDKKILNVLESYDYETSQNFDSDGTVRKYFPYLTKYDIYKITHMILSLFGEHKILSTIDLKYGKINQSHISEVKDILSELLSPNNKYIRKMISNNKKSKSGSEDKILGEKLLEDIIIRYVARVKRINIVLNLLIKNFYDYFDGNALDIDFLLSQKSSNIELDEIIFNGCIKPLFMRFNVTQKLEDIITFQTIINKKFDELKTFLKTKISKNVFKVTDISKNDIEILNRSFESLKIKDGSEELMKKEKDNVVRNTNKLKIVKLNFIFDYILSLDSDEESVMGIIEDEIDNYDYDVDFYKTLSGYPLLLIINIILNKKINTKKDPKSKTESSIVEDIMIKKFISNIQSPIYNYVHERLNIILSDMTNYAAELQTLAALPINIRSHVFQIRLINEITPEYNLLESKSMKKILNYYEEREERFTYLKDLFSDNNTNIKLEYMIKTIKSLEIRNYYTELIYNWKRDYIIKINKIMHLVRLT